MTPQGTVKILVYNYKEDFYQKQSKIKYLDFNQLKKYLLSVDFVQGNTLGAAGRNQGKT